MDRCLFTPFFFVPCACYAGSYVLVKLVVLVVVVVVVVMGGKVLLACFARGTAVGGMNSGSPSEYTLGISLLM